uniref:BED-type domain-containing protein n=1 Tax=Nelumbo nucifera TaxID=4432 RepID=A0A822YTC7_NELNU|nr:TPA_asm: hypothetical protein HUJ06_004686 [Nelumbo nucifera]
MESQSPNANTSNPVPSQESISSNVRGKTDSAWEYVSLQVDLLNGSKSMTCLYCQKTFKGRGINRMKQHLAQRKCEIAICRKVPHDVMFKMEQSLNEINDKKRSEKQLMNFVDTIAQCGMNDNDDDIEIREIDPPSTHDTYQGKKPTTSSGKGKASLGLIISHFAPRTTLGAQPGIKSVLASKGVINHVDYTVMKWLYDACIPLNVLRSRYFHPMFDALATIGPGYKAHSYHNCRTKMFKDLFQEVQMSFDKLRKDWAIYSCIIMAYDWTDTRSRTLINFLVYCPTGTAFEIGKMDYVANVVQHASRITKFVYSHIFLLLMLRKRPYWTEIIHPGATCFATNFIALDSILKQMHDLQNLVTDQSFIDSRYAKDAKGKEVRQIVLDFKFWAQCKMIVGFTSPLVNALTLADSEFRPPMGYMYHAMLHLAGYYFNLTFQYNPKPKVKSSVVMSAVFYVIKKLAIKLDDVEIKLNKELTIFENCRSNFGRPFSVKTFKSIPLGEWWSRFGCDAPNLKRIIIRILSQTCSSSGCECNWSVFERIHMKRRNRLEHQRLNDLLYVHCNLHVMDGKCFNFYVS